MNEDATIKRPGGPLQVEVDTKPPILRRTVQAHEKNPRTPTGETADRAPAIFGQRSTDNGSCHSSQYRVLYDFDAEQATDVSIRRGEIVNVFNIRPSGWYEGTTPDGRTGRFPGNFVEPVTSNAASGCSSTPSSPKPTSPKAQPMKAHVARRRGSAPTEPLRAQLPPRQARAKASSPALLFSRAPLPEAENQSPTPSSPAQPPESPPRPSVQEPVPYRVLFDFDAEQATDLTIRRGQIVSVFNIRPSGWYEGTLPDGQSGRFPGNFVEVVKITQQT